MRRSALLAILPLLPLAFAAQSSGPGAARAAPAADAAVRCIDTRQIVARHAQPPGSVVFEMVGGITYRNDLIGGCPGVARANSSSIVQTESDDTRLCTNDSLRVYDPVEARGVGSRAFARCRLGAFTPVVEH